MAVGIPFPSWAMFQFLSLNFDLRGLGIPPVVLGDIDRLGTQKIGLSLLLVLEEKGFANDQFLAIDVVCV